MANYMPSTVGRIPTMNKHLDQVIGLWLVDPMQIL